jgi:hypothetical protein
MLTHLTLEQARTTALTRLSSLVDLAENLDSEFPSKGFLDSAIKLNLIKARFEKTLEPTIQDSDFNDLQQFATILIKFDPGLEPKLRLWWGLYQDVIDGLKEKDEPYNLQGVISTLKEKMELSDAFSLIVSNEARKQTKSNILLPVSLLLVHVIRVESIEYAIREQLNDAITKFGLGDKYDVAEMCSVEHKIKKGSKWNSDVHAMRDAIAHGYFKITFADVNEWSIDFKNIEKGYDYQKTFSRLDFQRFFNGHSLLYKFQFSLWNIIELMILITAYYSKIG